MMPITFSDGTLNANSWATDRPGGFSTTELGEVYSLLPILALLLEVAVTRKVAGNVLDTYIGRDAARRVLAGDITLGSGETITAALWYCDMRGFTVMTETLPRDEVLATLNDYFECMVGAVHAQHGSVLKFMGDGMLAIFACGDAPICDAASCALGAAVDALEALTRSMSTAWRPANRRWKPASRFTSAMSCTAISAPATGSISRSSARPSTRWRASSRFAARSSRGSC